MGLVVPLKKISFLFLLLILAAFVATPFAAGRLVKLAEIKKAENDDTIKELEYLELMRHGEGSEIHERVLKMNSHDYGRYDPTPARRKPSYKLIPN